MSRIAAALALTIGAFAVALPAQAGTVPPPMTQEAKRPVSASGGPLINRPSTDTFWEEQQKNGP